MNVHVPANHTQPDALDISEAIHGYAYASLGELAEAYRAKATILRAGFSTDDAAKRYSEASHLASVIASIANCRFGVSFTGAF